MANVCPASHKHAATGTCWTHHSCRCTPCSRKENRRVSEAYRHERRVKNLNRRIPAIGAARRLQALACMGWSCRAIAARTGIDIMHVNEMRRHLRGTVLLSTHHTVDKVFRELSIVRAEGRSASFTVKHAARHGWVPPAAWDRIDDPNEQPKGVGVPRVNGIDEELVERFWREGLSDREIGERMGCNHRSVFMVRKRMGWETKWAA